MLNLFLALQEHATGATEAAHGAGSGTHAEVLAPMNWLPGVTALVVFAIAFLVLGIFVWPKITKALDDREQKIRSEIESAEAAREQAKAALADYQRNLSKAQDEANQMIAKARADAKALAEDLRTTSQAELTEMKQRATREIESAKHAAISSIYAEATNLGITIAGKILQREINERDQQFLVEESINELAQAGKNG